MAAFLARVYVSLKPTVNDPQGLTIAAGLQSLGFAGVGEVHARYLVGASVGNYFGPDLPLGTFIVNVSGSFLIGVVLSFVGGGLLSAGARPFIIVGVLGGYTTFSTYTHETLQLIQDG